jgi:GTPase-activating protein
MNEIVGTLYFVLANDEHEEWACEAEADTYFLFNTLMVEMRDIFVPDLDEADTGIQGRMTNMLSLLSLHDPQVRSHLDDCGIDPGFYSIRWLTTLLSREFLLADTIRLWDSMFASTHKDNFMRYVCVCMVMIIREELLEGDFGTCLKLLQSYPPTDVEKLLEASRALWIYESQVTLACHKGGISLNHALTTIAPPPAVLMAYGLPGGFAIDQIERMRQEMMQAKSSMGRNRGGFRKAVGRTYSNSGNTSTGANKSFFGGLFTKK